MKVERVLVELEKLLRKWGIKPSDWILVAGYAYRLLGYDIKVRQGHFNILTTRDRVPWKIEEGIEIHPPRGTLFREEFREFIEKTGFDFDINLSSKSEFEKKKGKFEYFLLPGGVRIKVQKPIGAIEELEKLLSLSTKNALGTERLQKDIVFIQDMIKALNAKGDVKVANKFERLLQRYEKAQKAAFRKKPLEGAKELTGIVASSGNAVGPVRIVQKSEDVRRLQKGDILVTQMTSPTLLVAVPKIAALVTDWGGRLSHAAILAREIGIPCLVGTQTATQVFENGDLVEVDAEKGVVRKLGK